MKSHSRKVADESHFELVGSAGGSHVRSLPPLPMEYQSLQLYVFLLSS